MTTQVQHTRHGVPQAALAKEDGKAFFVIFASAFVVLLAMALVAQTLGLHWRSWLPGAEGVKSVTGGVKAAVYTFMSHLQ
jgi:light-harvesting complex 1 beta chain